MPRLRKPKDQEEEAPPPVVEAEGAIEIDLSEPVKASEADGEKEPKKQQPPEEPIVVEPQEDEEKLALRRRVEELERAEKAARDAQLEMRQKDEALRQAQIEARRFQEDAAQSHYDSIINNLAAAQAEADVAQADLVRAGESADYKLHAEATRRMSLAASKINALEDAKATLDRAFEQQRQAPPPPPRQDFEAQIANAPEKAKIWLRQHPEYVTDPEKRAEAGVFHKRAIRAGFQELSPEYFDYIETELGLKQRQGAMDEDESPPKKSAVVSAPVTREAPSLGSGKPLSNKVTLTAAEVDMAQRLGLEPQEYARQKLKMAQLKKEGHYQ